VFLSRCYALLLLLFDYLDVPVDGLYTPPRAPSTLTITPNPTLLVLPDPIRDCMRALFERLAMRAGRLSAVQVRSTERARAKLARLHVL
jgi:hypothetical protein